VEPLWKGVAFEEVAAAGNAANVTLTI